MKHISLFILILLFCQHIFAQNTCEKITTAALEKLPLLIQQNEYDKIKTITQTIEASCGKTEFTQRIEIIYNLINKQNSAILINEYVFSNRMDDKLIYRWDESAKGDYNTIYNRKKSKFEYIPLQHIVDSLLKVKAVALLKSENYSFSTSERSILNLFADNIAEFKRTTTGHNSTLFDKDEKQYDNDITIGIHAGVFKPLSNDNYYFTAPTFGISVMTPFKYKWIGELQYKLRTDSRANNIFINDDGRDVEINAQSLHNIGLGIGYKLLHNKSWIILPKLNFGLGFIWTGISENTIEVDEYGDEYESVAYKNVNTLHSTGGISIMRHIKKKMYIGTEISYHYIPYTSDSKLLSPIQSKYASWEIFFRF